MNNKPKYLSMLAQFRSERGLTGQEGDLTGNVKEELKECFVELVDGNMDKAIGEACDIVVFLENYLAREGITEVQSVFHESLLWEISNLAKSVSAETLSRKECEYAVTLLRSGIINEGYDFDLYMEETCKKILSRKGAWDEDKGKWCKFTDDESKALWYEPDYSKCKL